MLPVALILSAAIGRIIRSHRRLAAPTSFTAPVLALLPELNQQIECLPMPTDAVR
jgi:hypothetical protein